MIGHLFDIIIAAATDNWIFVLLTHQSVRAGILETLLTSLFKVL